MKATVLLIKRESLDQKKTYTNGEKDKRCGKYIAKMFILKKFLVSVCI